MNLPIDELIRQAHEAAKPTSAAQRIILFPALLEALETARRRAPDVASAHMRLRDAVQQFRRDLYACKEATGTFEETRDELSRFLSSYQRVRAILDELEQL